MGEKNYLRDERHALRELEKSYFSCYLYLSWYSSEKERELEMM
jgi:hypothetical protein